MTWKDKIDDVYRKWENDSEYFSITTSGSTGKPKVIQLEKKRMRRSAEMSLSFFELSLGDPVLLALPADKVGGMMLIIRSIIGGLKLHTVEPKLNPLSKIDLKEDLHFCSLTPAQLTKILQNPHSHEQVRKIRKILLGGSALTPDLASGIKNEQNQYFHSYGMTETISHVAIKNLTEGHSHFAALEGVSFTKNEKQQLTIHAPHLIAEAITTNDLVELLDEKRMIWKGRVDNVVNSGGIKIVVEEVEGKIRERFDGAFYLVGEEDAVLGERLVIVTQSTLPDLSFLPKYEQPKRALKVNAFQYTTNGKLLRLTPQQLSDKGL